VRPAIDVVDVDEFGLFEGLEDDFAVGFVGVGEEDLVVAEL
jgi:hypothetical protein